MMIQTANSAVVMTIDFMPKPNRTIRTGTSAVSGALRKMFTQGSSSSSTSRFFPIRMPTGIPMATAENTPEKNACAVSDNAFWKAGVPTMAKKVATTSDNGGRKNVSPLCPTASQSSPQRIRDDIPGSRNPRTCIPYST